MRATLSFDVEVSSIQKATALREKHAALLTEDPDVTLIHDSSAQATSPYRVVGVDVQAEEPFTETVQATDKDDAREQVASSTKVVAEVEPA